MINNKKRVQSILVMGFGLSLILASNVKSKDVLVSTVTPDTPMQKLDIHMMESQEFQIL